MQITVKTSGSPDEQAGQICSAIEAANDDINIICEDNSFDHHFGTETIWSYYIEDPNISVTVQPEDRILPEIREVMEEINNFEDLYIDINRHRVVANLIDWNLRPGSTFEIELELRLKGYE